MTTSAPDTPSVDPVADDLVAAELESAEFEARQLWLEQRRAELPNYLTLDDEGNVGPAPGYQVCPACRGTAVMPDTFPLSPALMACPHCDGWGSVSTGSRLAETQNKTCDSCNGNGYVDKVSWLAAHPPDPEPYVGS